MIDGGERVLPACGLSAEGQLGDVCGVIFFGAEPAGAEEGGVLGARQAGEAPVENGEAQAFQGLGLALDLTVGVGFGGADPGDLAAEPGAGFDQQAGFRPAGLDGAANGIGTWGALWFPIAEAGLDLGFHCRRIEVADGHQDGAVGPIVAVIELGDTGCRCGFQHLHLADG